MRGRSGKTYIGCTFDLEKRLKQHREGNVVSTKKMLPVELIYYEEYTSKKDAFGREKKLKHHGSALMQLKKRLQDILAINKKGGAG